MKIAEVTFSMEVTPEEQASATHVRVQLKEFIVHLEEFQEFFDIFFESIDELESGKELIPIASVLKKYQIKLREMYNNIIRSMAAAIHAYQNIFTDSEMDAMQDIVLQNVAASRDSFIELMQQMDNFDEDDFIEDAKESYEQINKYLEKAQETVTNEWFGHIDHDILGKIRLSNRNFPLFARGSR